MCEAKEMEGELKNFIRLCVLTIAFLLHSYFIAAKIPKGLPRLISLLPVITFLSILPFDLNSLHIGFPTWFCVAWLANFKLLLFAFDQGPLSVPKHDLLCFILMACFPFKIRQNPSPKKPLETKTNPILEAATRATIVSTVVYTYNNYEHYFHKHVLFIYFFYTYHAVQLLLALAATPAQFLGVELEPRFNAPLFSTSLQDFWGHRWNLRVSEILRATVYIPVRRISTRIIGPRWASLPGVFLTFLVSGLMHELLVYHMTRERPTWEVTWFFILQGVFVDMEIVLKKKLVATNKFRLHKAISGPLALANIAVTAGWLSYTQALRNGIDEKLIKEFNMFMQFLKGMAISKN
ncbi:Wax synthase domain - like 3 [Theobroma cacao]|uniref:Probable long-chain-alcohol O-fatty-acyltransferase 5 n=1 Tax=Theobroma cacao TaxID=3641 RepID=A0AB32W8D5_THECC|nr:PREDICTED: probable long-chain-alcohol O-fatty-acyltransferase 5 [Theobroma cacao]WRX20538.1 Wax synthase domain - like 3 [Theobroma cacao]